MPFWILHKLILLKINHIRNITATKGEIYEL